MKVANFMSKELITIDIDRSLRDARRLMEKHGVSRLVVTDEGRVVGIITERDMVRRLGTHVERKLSDAHVFVSAACTKKLITIEQEESVGRAARLMLKHGISSLVVSDDGRVVGILTKTDLIKALRGSRIRVKSYMSSPVITVVVGEDLLRVRRLMLEHGIKRVVVKLGRRIVGILTEGDVARALGLFRKLSEAKHWDERLKRIRVEDVMSREVITIDANDMLGKCVKLMLEHDISGLPVVEAGKLVGITTKTDLLRALAERYPSRTKIRL
jgi:CBS domain-containing protein